MLHEVADTWLELPFPEARFVRVEVFRELDPSAIPHRCRTGSASMRCWLRSGCRRSATRYFVLRGPGGP